MSTQYDDEINALINEEETEKRTKKRPSSGKREMSDNPKEQIAGEPVVSIEGSNAIDIYKKSKAKWARLRHEAGLQKYKDDEIDIIDNKLVPNEERYQKRIANDNKLMQAHHQITNSSAGGVNIPIAKQLPQFDAKRGFKAYDEKVYQEKGEIKDV